MHRVFGLTHKNPMHGKHHSEETKRKISKALTDYWRTIPLG
ncbi:hypothetical protein IMSAGC014_01817 [Bacteroidaceae bacterium]|nr:hypothetical protein IMSAGC014_01817 [Bacteroidaceae bacterium]